VNENYSGSEEFFASRMDGCFVAEPDVFDAAGYVWKPGEVVVVGPDQLPYNIVEVCDKNELLLRDCTTNLSRKVAISKCTPIAYVIDTI